MNIIRLLNNKLLLFSLCAIGCLYPAASQESVVGVSIGGGLASRDLMFTSERAFKNVMPWVNLNVPMDIRMYYQYGFSKRWALRLEATYRNITLDLPDSEFRQFNGVVYDYKIDRMVRNYLAPGLFITYQGDGRKRKLIFQAAAGIVTHLPLACYDEISNYRYVDSRITYYEGDEFSEGILLGPKIEVGAVYDPWNRDRRKKMSFTTNLFGELLFYDAQNVRMVTGINVGVRYSLN